LELAARLSYLFWASTPDDALLDAAESGALASTDQITAEAQRLLADPRAHATVVHFHDRWLGLYELDHLFKDQSAYPLFTTALGQDFKKETETFVDHVIWDSTGAVPELFNATYSFMDGPLRRFYGIPGRGAGTGFSRVDLPSQRIGVLSQSSFLATMAKPSGTAPVQRGLFVREKVLCQEIPPPPPIVANIVPPVTSTAASLRDQLTMLTSVEPCHSCHQSMNPIGFAFESFDGIGSFRTVDEAGHPVVTSGDLIGTSVDGPFHGAPDLIQRLATSHEAQRCVATHWFRYAYGREEADPDSCTIDQLDHAMSAAGGSIQALLLELTKTDAFRFRNSTQGG
jgi:hypothetical protein